MAGLTLNADGSYAFDPSNAAYQNLAQGQARAVAANYSVADGKGGTAASTLTITVTGTNDAPVTVADGYTLAEDTTLTATVAGGLLANDSDSDLDPLTAVLVAGPANAKNFTLNVDDSFNYTPTGDFDGTDSFIYKANDGRADGATRTVALNVTAVNGAPTVTLTPPGTAVHARQGGKVQVNTAIANDQVTPKVVTLSNGGHVVVWSDFSQGIGGAAGDDSGRALKSQVFAANGARLGTRRWSTRPCRAINRAARRRRWRTAASW